MPNITDKEFEEYIMLKQKEEERQKMLMEIAVKSLPKLIKERKTMETAHSLAAAYAKRLQRMSKLLNNRKVFTLRWKDEKDYLTDRCLGIDHHGKLSMKQSFRMWMARYGWRFKIDHRRGILEARKQSPS